MFAVGLFSQAVQFLFAAKHPVFALRTGEEHLEVLVCCLTRIFKSVILQITSTNTEVRIKDLSSSLCLQNLAVAGRCKEKVLR